MKPSRTIITRSRFTTSTPSWWAKPTLLLLLVASFIFVSCEDNPLAIGFKKDPRNFQVLYRELPVPSSTFLADSLPTYNTFSASATNRFLVGTYTDPKFGTVRSEFYSQIRPSDPSKSPETNAVFDSVTLKLRIDNYHYGSRLVTPQTITIYELEEALSTEKEYFNRTPVSLGTRVIGQSTLTVSPENLDGLVADRVNDTIVFSSVLNKTFGKRLFDHWQKHDTTFTKQELFNKIFRGIAVAPTNSDKILGINPVAGVTELVLHYHVDAVKYQYDFYLDNIMGYSRVTSDRSGTAIAEITQSKVEVEPADKLGYVQSGVGVFVNFSMQSLLNLKDTVPEISFNSVELEIPVENYDAATPPPSHLSLRLINEENEFENSGTLIFNQFMIPDSGTDGIYMRNDITTIGSLVFDKDKKVYRGFYGQFAQNLVQETDSEKRYLRFTVYPNAPSPTKSVHRVVFDPAKVKLKVYYTKPLKNSNPE